MTSGFQDLGFQGVQGGFLDADLFGADQKPDVLFKLDGFLDAQPNFLGPWLEVGNIFQTPAKILRVFFHPIQAHMVEKIVHLFLVGRLVFRRRKNEAAFQVPAFVPLKDRLDARHRFFRLPLHGKYRLDQVRALPGHPQGLIHHPIMDFEA
jgi:hypothetical protein